MNFSTTLFFSMLGGILPALVWLWFWLKEDRLHPEPKARLLAVFLAGMASVFLVLPIEKFIFSSAISELSILTIVLWAAVEEIFKYLAALATALKARDNDEPIDTVIYMVTAALGFSAIENTLFLLNVVGDGNFAQSVITGNSRFLGATLLHVSSSAIIGVLMGLSYYKRKIWKKIFLYTGLVASIVLHTVFNLLIIELKDGMFFVFAGVWVLVILLVVLIEKVKAVKINKIQF